MVEPINCKLINWETIHEAVKEVTSQIKRESFHPDYVVAIARGGVVPARLICDELHLKNLITIKADHWGITANKEGKAVLSQGTNVDLNNKNILLIDDITDTGESMTICKDYLETLKPKNVKTVALYHLSGSKFIPDFFGKEEDWSWMIWPWNYKEDIVNLTQKILAENITNVSGIQKELLEKYKVYLEEDEIEELLDHIEYLNNR